MELDVKEHVVRLVEIKLTDRLDASNAMEWREQLHRLPMDGTSHFVVDLSDVPFLDSAGMATLVSLLKRARQAGSQVTLVWPKAEAARRIIHLTKFDQVFDMAESVAAVLERYSGQNGYHSGRG